MKLNLLIVILTIIFPVYLNAQDTTIYKLDKAVVTASRMHIPLKNIPQKVEIINNSIIETYSNNNLGDILKRTTNLDIIEYPGAMTTVGLRGFPATAHSRNYTVILIDGMPSGTNNLATIPADFIEHVEVVKGPYSVLYGSDAMGGVINIITKNPSKTTTGKVGMSMGNFGHHGYTGYISAPIFSKLLFSMGFSRQEQNNDYRIGGSNLLKLSQTEKYILDEKSYGDIMNNTKFQINQFNSKINYLINDKWNVGLYTTLMISNDIELPGNYWHSYGLSKKDINRFSNYLQVKYVENNNELLITPYLSNQKESNYDNNTDLAFINSKQELKQYGVKIGNTHSWGNFKWLVGLDYDFYDVQSERFSKKATPTNPYRPDHTRQVVSGFTQIAYFYRNLSLNAGARYNYMHYTLQANSMLNNEKSSENYSNFNPSIGLKYNVLKDLNVHASFGTAFYVPDAYQSAGQYKVGKKTYIGNKDLKPETTTSFDVGMSFNVNNIFNIDVTYFENYYDNKIVSTNRVNGVWTKDSTTYENATKGFMSGIELLASSNISKFWDASDYSIELHGGLTYSLKNNFEVKAEKDATVKKDALYIRKAKANFGINFSSTSGFEVRIDGRYIGHRLENDWMLWDNLRPNIKTNDYYDKDGYTFKDQILQHSAHLVFDFAIYYTFINKIRIGITAANFLDENYTEKDGYNMPGRNVMGHISFKF